jgi:hypothetical protein
MQNVFLIGADQKSVNAYAKNKLISAVNTRLFSLVVRNNHATDSFWVQVFDLTAADEAAANTAADSVTAEFEVECPGGLFVPFTFAGGWQFTKGCYVRCVSTDGGAAAQLIGGNNAKITAAFMNGPISA